MLSLLIIISYVSYESFVFPKLNDNIYICNNYNITWNNDDNINNLSLILLHKDTNSFLGDSLSKFENGDIVLNEKVTSNNYLWNVPRDLNYYDLEHHYFKFILTNKSDLFSSALNSNTNSFHILSDYFKIISNMNVTNPKNSDVINPTKVTKIKWNGFLDNINIIIQNYNNNKWNNINDCIIPDVINTSLKNELLWSPCQDINQLSNNLFRIKIRELNTNIIRYSESFNSFGLKFIHPINDIYNYDYRTNPKLFISWDKINFIDSNATLNLYNNNIEYIQPIFQNKILLNDSYIWIYLQNCIIIIIS